MDNVTYLGTSDEVNACDCCGKADLKSTVALEVNGATVYYGVTCAANALRTSATAIRQGTKQADEAKAEVVRLAREKAEANEFSRWSSFCAAHGTGTDLFTRIQSLGGYKAAKALYAAVSA